jgi:hypothetical protein
MEIAAVPSEIWGYRDVALGGIGLVGFEVEATDGPAGTVDEATNDVPGTVLVVEMGSRLLGRKVVVPAEMVARVDGSNGIVFLDRSREELKDAPAYRAGESAAVLAETSAGLSRSANAEGRAAAPR